MSTAKDSKEVATKGTTELADMSQYSQYAGAGFENQNADDISIPFILILQALSPQVQAQGSELRQGQIINSVTGEVWGGDKGIVFVPATTKHEYIEWIPRNAGGGFVAAHALGSDVVLKYQGKPSEKGAIKMDNGNDLVETFSVYGILVDDAGNFSQAVISFNSTKIKKYRGWMTKARTIQLALPDGRRVPAPLFAHRYRLKTIQEKNAQGTFANWDTIGFDGENAVAARLAVNDPLFQAAVQTKASVETGAARPNYEASATVGDDVVEEGRPDGKPKF